MPVPRTYRTEPENRLSRMISFRLSEEEFQRLKWMCSVNRATSVSEMARIAVNQWIENTATEQEESTVADFEGRLTELERKMEKLNGEIREIRRAKRRRSG